MKKQYYFLCFLFVLTFAACQETEFQPLGDFEIGALPVEVIAPANNPITEEKIKLGRLLFFDPILSANNKISCASCHSPSKGFTDGLQRSVGFTDDLKTTRNSPTILNAAFNGMNHAGVYDSELSPMFYDNRASSLEEQSLGPLLSPVEMMGPEYSSIEYIPLLEKKIEEIEEYRILFKNAFGDSAVTIDKVTKALAAYERTLITPNSPFDRFARGETNAMNKKQIRGLQAFIDAGCNTCHSGPMFSDFKLHTLGVQEHPGLTQADKGDGEFAFRTTTLRNLSFTAPYMHNGTQQSLEEVMRFYENKESENVLVANDELADEFLDLKMRPFDQSRKDEIIAFLKALDDPNFDTSQPETVPSKLNIK
jgi:cytochrome c peroxidase